MFTLVLGLIFGVITAMIGSSKGRSGSGWFFVGFLLGLIGLIIALCMSDLNEEQRKHAHMLNEQRRLREQLRQERMRNQAFQNYTNARLDTHDRTLKLDTRSADAQRVLEGGVEFDEEAEAELLDPEAPGPRTASGRKIIYRKSDGHGSA